MGDNYHHVRTMGFTGPVIYGDSTAALFGTATRTVEFYELLQGIEREYDPDNGYIGGDLIPDA